MLQTEVMRAKLLNVRLSEDEWVRVELLAALYKLSTSDVIRKLLKDAEEAQTPIYRISAWNDADQSSTLLQVSRNKENAIEMAKMLASEHANDGRFTHVRVFEGAKHKSIFTRPV